MRFIHAYYVEISCLDVPDDEFQKLRRDREDAVRGKFGRFTRQNMVQHENDTGTLCDRRHQRIQARVIKRVQCRL